MKLNYTDKLSKAKLGRKRIYREDGTWFMSESVLFLGGTHTQDFNP
jgi:hypothetical protein